jgi:hypothetical protein
MKSLWYEPNAHPARSLLSRAAIGYPRSYSVLGTYCRLSGSNQGNAEIMALPSPIMLRDVAMYRSDA